MTIFFFFLPIWIHFWFLHTFRNLSSVLDPLLSAPGWQCNTEKLTWNCVSSFFVFENNVLCMRTRVAVPWCACGDRGQCPGARSPPWAVCRLGFHVLRMNSCGNLLSWPGWVFWENCFSFWLSWEESSGHTVVSRQRRQMEYVLYPNVLISSILTLP